MTEKFRCILVTKSEAGQKAALSDFSESDLVEGDVTVGVTHSTLNYKDGLAVTGSAPVVRKFPLIAGIDFAGHVLTSSDARFKPGDAVVANGWGMGETHHGGYATRARVKGDWLVQSAARIQRGRCDGDRHRRLHVDAGRDGARGSGTDAGTRAPVLVTGAAGGVGGVAIASVVQARLSRDRGDRADERGGLSARAWVPRKSSTGRS